MSQQANCVTRIDRFTNYLIQLAREADELNKQSFDVGLATAASGEKLQAVQDAGLNYGDETETANTIDQAINLVDAIGDLTNNRAVTQADWLSVMNKVNVGGGKVEKLDF